MADSLELVIRTPRETVLRADVRAARVPAQTGQVGLRPRAEPFALLIGPGLVLLHTTAGMRFAATAGGLLESRRNSAVLFTPFAVLGEDEREVSSALARVLETPDSDVALRLRLDELEQRVLREVQQRRLVPRAGGRR